MRVRPSILADHLKLRARPLVCRSIGSFLESRSTLRCAQVGLSCSLQAFASSGWVIAHLVDLLASYGPGAVKSGMQATKQAGPASQPKA
jgi:hypothetical protein